MKKFVSLLVAVVLVVPVFAGAQGMTFTLPDPGMLPDSPFYFLKSWGEGIRLFFTFNAEKKAEQYLRLAEVRLAEYERLIAKGKEQIAEKTLEKYEGQLGRPLAKAEELKGKGEGAADELKTKAEEAVVKHLTVLERNLTNVSEPAREGIERALEASKRQLEKLDDAVLEDELSRLLEGLDAPEAGNIIPPTKQIVLRLFKGVALDEVCSSERVPGSYGSCVMTIVPLSAGEWKVVVTYDGLFDDSIKAERFEGVVHYRNGQWGVSDITRLRQCWPNRGHQNFSLAACDGGLEAGNIIPPTKQIVLRLFKGVALDEVCSSERVPGSYGSCVMTIVPLSAGEWKVVVTYDGLFDDSIKAERFEGVVHYRNGQWGVSDITRLRQCWPNRGHQNFSLAACF